MTSCREYESEIALEAGGDLEGEVRRRLRSHLKLCSRCQSALDRMKSCLEPLAVVARDESDIRDSSVWQPIARALRARSGVQGARQFNGWVAALATAALLLAAVGIAEQLPGVFNDSGDMVADGQFPFEGEKPRAGALTVAEPALPGAVSVDRDSEERVERHDESSLRSGSR